MRYFAELHDAELEDLASAGSEIAFRIVHIAVFLDVGASKATVWSYGGTLTIGGAAHRPRFVKGQVSEVVGMPNLIELQQEPDALVRGFRWQTSRVLFTDGSTLSLAEGDAVLRLDSKHGWLEDWDGPLWDQGTAGDVLVLRDPPHPRQ